MVDGNTLVPMPACYFPPSVVSDAALIGLVVLG